MTCGTGDFQLSGDLQYSGAVCLIVWGNGSTSMSEEGGKGLSTPGRWADQQCLSPTPCSILVIAGILQLTLLSRTQSKRQPYAQPLFEQQGWI